MVIQGYRFIKIYCLSQAKSDYEWFILYVPRKGQLWTSISPRLWGVMWSSFPWDRPLVNLTSLQEVMHTLLKTCADPNCMWNTWHPRVWQPKLLFYKLGLRISFGICSFTFWTVSQEILSSTPPKFKPSEFSTESSESLHPSSWIILTHVVSRRFSMFFAELSKWGMNVLLPTYKRF